MKKLIVLTAMAALSTLSVSATEPLLLQPLSPMVLSTIPGVTQQTTDNNEVKVSAPGSVDAVFTPGSDMGNMVPQNAAAEGKPVPVKPQPRVRIQTKQRSQGNSYWNAGGKGTKSYF